MKTNLFIPFLFLLASCQKDEIIKPYTFEAWIQDEKLHISYESKQIGFTIWVSSDLEHTSKDTQSFKNNTSSSCGVQSTSLFWHPTYVTLETDLYHEMIIIQ